MQSCLRWHKEDRKVDNMLRHPADGSQWRGIDREFPDFAKDARNLRFALSTDEFNPFGDQSSSHSTWPITPCIYNLPPWLCMKRKFIIMPVLIQGPKQPGNDIAVYLRHWLRNSSFYRANQVCVCGMSTINDWPALSNLSGQTNKGYNACTHCFSDLQAVYLKKCRKIVYLGHRQFLAKNHQLRKKGKHFKGTIEHRSKPGKRDGAEVFEMVKDLKVVFGKGEGSEPVLKDASGRAPMWKKKSIFWKLPFGNTLRSATPST